MFGAFGPAAPASSVTFVSPASLELGIAGRFRGKGLLRTLAPVSNTRRLGKRDMVLNASLPKIEVDPQTYEVRVDGEPARSNPAAKLPMAQRYFLF